MDIFAPYIMPVAMVICAIVCYILKNLVQTEKFDRFIPLISAIIGLIIVVWTTLSFTPETVAQGLVSGLAATGMYELVKQFTKMQFGAANTDDKYYISDEELSNDGEDK